jgi:hypothetical protein
MLGCSSLPVVADSCSGIGCSLRLDGFDDSGLDLALLASLRPMYDFQLEGVASVLSTAGGG